MNVRKDKPSAPFSAGCPSTLRAAKFGLTLAVCVAILTFLALKGLRLDDTAALYVGLPILLALTLSITAPCQSAIGSSLKAMAIFLLLSAPILKEGFICIIMAAPIFFAVAAAVGGLIDWYRVYRKRRSSAAINSPIVIAFLALLAFEGTHEGLSFERFNEISVSRVIAADTDTVADTLSRPPSFDKQTPLLTRIFPKPVRGSGSGLEIGDSRSVEFLYFKHVFFTPHRGVARFQVAARGPGYVHFGVTHDSSYVSKYLRWRYSRVHWKALGPNRTRVTWTLGYDRLLDPAWYFHPLQSLYVRLTAGVLIDNLASPRVP